MNRRSAEDWEGVSKAGLRELRRQIDDPEGSSAAEMIATLVNEVIVDGQDFLTTEVTDLRSGFFFPAGLIDWSMGCVVVSAKSLVD